MEYPYKEADFHEYCPKCEYSDIPDVKDPCNDCLDNPCVMYSKKPVNFKPVDKK